MTNGAQRLVDDLNRLADLPAAAPQLLYWLLDGPQPLDDLIARRRALVMARGDDFIVAHYSATRSVLYDLGSLADWVYYKDGQFHLLDGYRRAVEFYARCTKRLVPGYR